MTQKVMPLAVCLIMLLLSCKKEQATILKLDDQNKKELKLSESDSFALEKYQNLPMSMQIFMNNQPIRMVGY